MRVDPRFRRLKKKATKVAVDKRFQGMFEEEQFVKPVKVDKYGRPVDGDREKRELFNYYRIEDEKEEERKDSGPCIVKPDPEKGEAGESSDEESSSSSESSDREQYFMDEALSSHPLVQRDIPMGDATSRLAVVNLDWDQIRAEDIYTLVYGFKPTAGSIVSVTVYPSKFGKERLARELVEGPPHELFKVENATELSSALSSSSSPSEKERSFGDGEEDFDSVILRRYQLERLRYYYAVVECDSIETAAHIYKNCDGSEFEKSANFLDFRFIPENVTFDPVEDGPIRDFCLKLPKKYKSKPDWCTAALQSSKVTLTWDADDAERTRITRRPMLGNIEEEEADLRAYLASTEGEDSGDEEMCADERIELYKSLAKDGGNSDNVFGRKGKEGKELSITFASALYENTKDDEDIDREVTFSATANGELFSSLDDASNSEEDSSEKTQFVKYMERRKIKKQMRKEAAKAKKEAAEKSKHKTKAKTQKDRLQGNKERAELSLFLNNEDDDDENVIKKSKHRDHDAVDVKDKRFEAIYNEPAFALDPTHRSFKRTKAMEKMIKERQRRKYT